MMLTLKPFSKSTPLRRKSKEKKEDIVNDDGIKLEGKKFYAYRRGGP